MPDTVTAPYGVTDNQVASISEGFTDGLWRPYQSVTRAQFVKMAVVAFDIPLMNPAIATFTDVPKGSHYYQYVEGAVAAGLVRFRARPSAPTPPSPVSRPSPSCRAGSPRRNGIDLATITRPLRSRACWLTSVTRPASRLPPQALVAFAFDLGITIGDKFGNFAGRAS